VSAILYSLHLILTNLVLVLIGVDLRNHLVGWEWEMFRDGMGLGRIGFGWEGLVGMGCWLGLGFWLFFISVVLLLLATTSCLCLVIFGFLYLLI
jgi:hypothetical protein